MRSALAAIAVVLVACKREPERVTIHRDPVDAAIVDATDPRDLSPPEIRIGELAAGEAVLAVDPSHGPGGVVRVVSLPPRRCWPSDPACSYLIEYGPGGVASATRQGRCTVDAHSGVVACGDFGKPLRTVTTIALDGGTDAAP